MFCGNCGQELQDDAKFCHVCGETVGAESAPVQFDGGFSGGAVPMPPKKAPKIWIPIVAGVAVLAVVVALLMSGIFSGPSGKLMRAMAKSGKAYAAAAEKMDMPDLSYIEEKQAYSAEMSLWFEEMDGYSEIEGLGIRMAADVSVPKRAAGVTIAPYLGSADLLNAQIKLDNDQLYIGSPELTGDTFYMINTQTLGQDLNNLGMGESDLDGFGFNIFDIAEQWQQATAENEDVAKEIEKAFQTFTKALEVEKTGTDTIDVNDNSLKCTVYHVVVPEDAMNTLLDSLEEAYAKLDTTDVYLDILNSMGLPDYVIEEMEYTMEYSAEDTEYMFDSLSDVVDELGDIELDMYVNSGYLVAAIYEDEIEGTEVEIILNLGGGKEYVDDLSLRMIVDGEELRITSTGNHSGADGQFTDETVVEIRSDGYNVTVLEMELSYEPKAKSDNFMFAMDMEDMALEMNGQITTTGDSIHMLLDELSISEYGYEMMTLGVEYKIGQYSASSINTGNSVDLGSLTQDELMDEMYAIEENAYEWAYDLMEKFPELMYNF